MSGDTRDNVRVVSERVVGTRGVLIKIVLGLLSMRECNLLPMDMSVGGFLPSGSHSGCRELKSPTVMHLALGGLRIRFCGLAPW